MTEKSSLCLKDRLALCAMLAAEYIVSGKNDAEFARMASERLGLKVTPSVVSYARASMDMPNNEIARREAKAAAAPRQRELLAADTVIKALVARIEKLEAASHTHLQGFGGMADALARATPATPATSTH